MTVKKSPFAGMKLSEQVTPARDQRLFQEPARQPVEQPESQPANNLASQKADTSTLQPAEQPNSQPVSKSRSQRQVYPKRTYHLREETITQLEDMQMALKRKYGIKRPLMEEIVELAITNIYEDFEENQQTSKLVSKLKSQTVNMPRS